VAVVLADNNSHDRTAELAQAAALQLGLDYRRVFEPEPGKFHALNRVLETIETPLVVTVDADTYLYPEALRSIVARVTEHPQDQHVCACAGAIVVENARANLLTRMQQWDYRPGINGVKRMLGRLQQRPRRAGRLLRLLDRGRPGGRRVAGRDRRGHRPYLDDDGQSRHRPLRTARTAFDDCAGGALALHAPALPLGARHVRAASIRGYARYIAGAGRRWK
jgi:glycosyltransferase involved in cell wall biosynthesis